MFVESRDSLELLGSSRLFGLLGVGEGFIFVLVTVVVSVEIYFCCNNVW